MKQNSIQYEKLDLVTKGENIYPVICENMKEIRMQKRITQQKMAIEMCIDQSTLSKYESGLRTPDLNYIFQFCESFNISIEYLLEL